jgi:hypothetical protein
VLGGIAAAFSAKSLWPLGVAAAGCALYVWLLVQQPVYEYIAALIIDKEGIWFLREVRPGGSASRFSWREIRSVSARLTSQGEENQGLEVLTTRYGPKGVPVLVPIGSEAECLEALRVAQSFVGAGAKSAAYPFVRGEAQRQATRPGPVVRGTFSPARAWRPAVGPASTQTLGECKDLAPNA